MPTARATTCGNSTGSAKPASPASHTPSANDRRTCPAARRASLVLPTPPTPVKVNSRVMDSSRLISANSRRRPTKLAISLGRLPVGSRLITDVTLPLAPPTGAAEKPAFHQGLGDSGLTFVCHRKVIPRPHTAQVSTVGSQGVAGGRATRRRPHHTLLRYYTSVNVAPRQAVDHIAGLHAPPEDERDPADMSCAVREPCELRSGLGRGFEFG